LPRVIPADPVVAGASLDPEGNPQLVLDPETLITIARAAADEPDAPPNARLPILVVDDSLTTRMLEQSILESAGYEVDLATSGEEGIQKARQQRYALCLVDVEMPGMNGFEFIRRIRTDPKLKDIPAILVTSRNAPEDRQLGEDVGAQGYIVKSDFDQAQLIDRISKLVG
jgi:two-component system chemotaxis sensor kinase CheA